MGLIHHAWLLQAKWNDYFPHYDYEGQPGYFRYLSFDPLY